MSRKYAYDSISTDMFYDMIARASKSVKRRRYVSDMLFEGGIEGNSFCKQIRKDPVKSAICINLYEFCDNSPDDIVPDERVAAYMTRIFHESHHAYQNAIIDTHKQNGKLEREIASMGIVCEFFPAMYKAGYGTDVREYGAEIAGIMKAAKYCKRHFPKFDYESAMLEHAKSDPYAIIKGDFRTFDEMVDVGMKLRDDAYGLTRKHPEFKLSADHGDRLDKRFVMEHVTKGKQAEYAQMSGHEQIVKMFDMLADSGILHGKEHKYLAYYYRYDKQLLYEHKGLHVDVPTAGMRPGSARSGLDAEAGEDAAHDSPIHSSGHDEPLL